MKLHLWPWIRTIVKEGHEQWRRVPYGCLSLTYDCDREFVVYKITNHWTGSERLKKVYLN